MKEEKIYSITAEGSLGILALGDIGLKKWREQRSKEGKDPYKKINETKQTDNGEETSK